MLDKEEILKFISQNKTRKEIANYYGYSLDKIKKFMKLNNIRIIDYIPKKHRDLLIEQKENILDFYKNVRSIRITSEYFNCTRGSLVDYFKKINFKYKKNNHIDLSSDISKIVDLYYVQNKTLKEISQLYNCSFPKISSLLKTNGYVIKNKIDLLKERNNSDVFQKKCMSQSARNKEYTLPSGNIIKLRGYEPNFLNYIFDNNLLNESDIIYKPERISYQYKQNQHFYYPDFFIPKLNLIIEIKSSWIHKKQGLEKSIQKKQQTIENGYNFLMIMDNDFTDFMKHISEHK